MQFNKINNKNKKGQVTIFVILAIIVIASGILITVNYQKIFPNKTLSDDTAIISDYISDCIAQKTEEGMKIMSVQAGYINLPEFEQGSEYMPFSSQLNFLGTRIPYWFYFSGNNLQRMQKPSLEKMEEELAGYVNDSVYQCVPENLDVFGFDIHYDLEKDTKVKINEKNIQTTVQWKVTVNYEGKTVNLDEHTAQLDTHFGQLYSEAEKIFEEEMQNTFLENYSLDVLRLNAPVSGFELSCVPKIWSKEKLKEEISFALQNNLLTLKVEGSEYDLSSVERKYFVFKSTEKIEDNVFFFYNSKFPMRFEVDPSEGDILRADPVGNQEGINLAGICYVPYHFVYDLAFPVLIQINNGEEIFQFPVLVVIDNMNQRNSTMVEEMVEEINPCSSEFKTQEISVNSFDESGKPIEAEVYYKCLTKTCSLGETKLSGSFSSLDTLAPICYNGKLIVSKDGYKDYFSTISTTESFQANVYLNKIYSVDLNIDLNEDEKGLLTFSSEGHDSFAMYPEQTKINLAEGNYNVSLYVFKDSNIILEKQTQEQCIDVPVSGILSLFGQTRKECYTVETPKQELTSVIVGGGKAEIYFSENQLKSMDNLQIKFERFNTPTSLDEISTVLSSLEYTTLEIKY